jgi:hypothetical protein
LEKDIEVAIALKSVYYEVFSSWKVRSLSSTRDFIIYVVIGIALLVSSLVLAFSSVSVRVVDFGPVILRYDPFSELLAFIFLSGGGYLMFRAGQAKPAGSVLKKSLVEQVKSVQENQ